MQYQCEWVVDNHIIPRENVFREVCVFLYTDPNEINPEDDIPVVGLDANGNWYQVCKYIDGQLTKLNRNVYIPGYAGYVLCSVPIDDLNDPIVAGFIESGLSACLTIFEQVNHGVALRVFPPVCGHYDVHDEVNDTVVTHSRIHAACDTLPFATYD